jgi:hydroxyacylglutathione hydrolase
MLVETITVSMFATNCYLVACPETREALVIDPGADGSGIIAKIKEKKFDVKYIINTHGHIDHIGANGKLKAELQVPLLLSEKDLELYHNPGFGLGLVLRKQPLPDHYMVDGEELKFGNKTLTVIETPGHTAGGVSLLVEKTLFCGDTLFAGSIGRTDLAGGSYDTLLKSIHERIMTLPPDTIIYPGHGPQTTVAAEAASNPFMLIDQT